MALCNDDKVSERVFRFCKGEKKYPIAIHCVSGALMPKLNGEGFIHILISILAISTKLRLSYKQMSARILTFPSVRNRNAWPSKSAECTAEFIFFLSRTSQSQKFSQVSTRSLGYNGQSRVGGLIMMMMNEISKHSRRSTFFRCRFSAPNADLRLDISATFLCILPLR